MNQQRCINLYKQNINKSEEKVLQVTAAIEQ